MTTYARRSIRRDFRGGTSERRVQRVRDWRDVRAEVDDSEQVRAESASSRAPSRVSTLLRDGDAVAESARHARAGHVVLVFGSIQARFVGGLRGFPHRALRGYEVRARPRRSATSPQAHPRRRHRRRPRPRGQRRGIPSAVQERRRPGSIPRGGRRGLARARHPSGASEPRRGARTRRIARGRPDAVRATRAVPRGPGRDGSRPDAVGETPRGIRTPGTGRVHARISPRVR